MNKYWNRCTFWVDQNETSHISGTDFAIDNPLLKSPVKIQKLGVKAGQFCKIEICSQKDH